MSVYLGFSRFSLSVLLLISLVALPHELSAQQNTLAITVTPPLIQLSIGPGETWNSVLKVVNNNTYAVTYYSQVVDFSPEGEDGQGSLIPLVGTTGTGESMTLGHWVSLSKEPITVESGESKDIPFTVSIPRDASPGGHYAAILVGTQPPPDTTSGPAMKVSSFVTSLLFVKIQGEVVERGNIREFFSNNTLYDAPKADFTLRFENDGNVHLQPKGNISIYNMWGKERGRVEINKDTNFGVVLPKSTRKFAFSWEGQWSVYDIGRYRAEVTLGFGDDAKQNAAAVTYFWVIPVVPVASVLGILFLFTFLILWFVRRYIRLALQLEAQRLGLERGSTGPLPLQKVTFKTFLKPIEEGVVDLRSISRTTSKGFEKVSHNGNTSTIIKSLTFTQFVLKYKLFLVFVTFLVVFLWLFVYFLFGALEADRPYAITNILAE